MKKRHLKFSCHPIIIIGCSAGQCGHLIRGYFERQGKVWVNRFRFEEVDPNKPLTHMETEYEMSVEPMNLSFEE
ncbi:hypothetical protein MKY42_30980 [Paenibacillus sp. FSL W7-1088]|uniref:hypothetical protein n=1 Tax=unclassified Paenibacillus TaxID=185978 RepID=UPI0015C59115|nr:hypothetical protein [Paenibacillus sp. E222]QLG37915.1 hypothetical protein HW560_07185 [Paenibacillus sp. E222]